MNKEIQKYIIGVDGGGTKTVAALADLKGHILKIAETGSTNPNKIGFERTIINLKKLLSELLTTFPQDKIALAFLGLAGGLERDKEKRIQIKRALQQNFSFPILVEGDQKLAYRSENNKKDGVIIIGGTGAIAMGWKNNKEAISGGWDWLLGDQGSAFWIGKRALEETVKIIDGRSKRKSKLTNLIFKKWRIKQEKEFYQKFYNFDFVEKVASVSELVDRAAQEKDKLAKEILKEAGKELAEMAKAVIKKLELKDKFPIVLSGGVFNSKIILETIKKEIKKIAPKAHFSQPERKPVESAINLALEKIKKLC